MKQIDAYKTSYEANVFNLNNLILLASSDKQEVVFYPKNSTFTITNAIREVSGKTIVVDGKIFCPANLQVFVYQSSAADNCMIVTLVYDCEELPKTKEVVSNYKYRGSLIKEEDNIYLMVSLKTHFVDEALSREGVYYEYKLRKPVNDNDFFVLEVCPSNLSSVKSVYFSDSSNSDTTFSAYDAFIKQLTGKTISEHFHVEYDNWFA
jgi:hypothetical protein